MYSQIESIDLNNLKKSDKLFELFMYILRMLHISF